MKNYHNFFLKILFTSHKGKIYQFSKNSKYYCIKKLYKVKEQFYFHKTEKKNTKTYIWENNITTFEQLQWKKWKKISFTSQKDTRYQFPKKMQLLLHNTIHYYNSPIQRSALHKAYWLPCSTLDLSTNSLN